MLVHMEIFYSDEKERTLLCCYVLLTEERWQEIRLLPNRVKNVNLLCVQKCDVSPIPCFPICQCKQLQEMTFRVIRASLQLDLEQIEVLIETLNIPVLEMSVLEEREKEVAIAEQKTSVGYAWYHSTEIAREFQKVNINQDIITILLPYLHGVSFQLG